MLESVKLTILAENRVADPRLLAEQGLSIFVETDYGNLLFDTGQTDAFLRNANELGIDLKTVKKIVLSHGHYDHTGGLPYFLDAIQSSEIICHPALTNKKYHVYPAGRLDIGVSWEKSKLISAGADFVFKTHATEIFPDIWISGEIPRNSNYEFIDENYEQKVLESYIQDEMHDELCLILNTTKGLIVLLGCGHSGPINSLKHAMRITENDHIFAVVGGMHLQHSAPERVENIVINLKKLNPDLVIPLHCTGFTAISSLVNKIKNRVKLLNVGDTFEMNN